LWQIHALDDGQMPLFDPDEASPEAREWPSHIPVEDLSAPLPAMSLGEQVIEDYHAIGMSLRAHPVGLLRTPLDRLGVTPNRFLATAKDGQRIKVAGLVLVRQRPGTASGVIFMTLEDEDGIANIVVWPKVFEANRRIVLGGRMVMIEGKLQREGIVVHIVADRVTDLTPLLHTLNEDKPDISRVIARADEVKRATTGDQRLLRQRSRDFH
jgi:DNA polymerase III alpha subunit